ncbi:hypothetical protein Tsubulata_038620 [Turnera subulata]|uniref:GPI ethanolamine phosphate transferase 3 n=1 Tax=Turnera subulata TaxID=218843 RepID=A0A9Q0FLI4_9ROSI|nr:hypothetical protein Tsubulata_038620 [Turnera subulata]
MEGRWWRRWYPWVILVVHVLAILIFTRGFLLTRTDLPFYSHCSDISQSPCSFSENCRDANDTASAASCWTKPAADRLVIIVLDALRIDFVAPSSFYQEKKPWMDRLTVLQNLASTRRSSAKIFKAIADPPTTSLQRLKGLTTGGLPTFIDVGNSFGAPAIVEDNLIHQLVQNGKRVVMMGDDTWTQLFPNHFNKSYPYPSFNVKDLHTVDNGCIEHLLPSLYEEDWDVLIAHFLGVDHAGHIFGVDSVPMVEKLDQYNRVLQHVIEVLESQSGPGGLHENTLLLVMGDHGQTLNGDHGGGGAEEVETSIFAMSFKEPPLSIPSGLDTSFCKVDSDGKEICISNMEQLDFAVTVSALLGIPFPFGSIGRVNAELYALGAGTWNLEGTGMGNRDAPKLEHWLLNYAKVLCINSWQVKRYIDVYSASSVIGFSFEDLLHVSDKYFQAEESWKHTTKNSLLHREGSYHSMLPSVTRQIDAFVNFLSYVSELARSKWTEFNLKMMGIGIGTMLLSIFIILFAIRRVNRPHGTFLPFGGDSGISFEVMSAFLVVAIRACSFLSNSYILEEGKVASFLLATTGIINLRHAVMKRKMLFEATSFLLLIFILRLTIEVGMSKQAATSLFMNASSSWMTGIAPGHPVWRLMTEIGPILALFLLGYLLYRTTIACSSSWGIWEFSTMGTFSSFLLIAVHWGSESNLQQLAILLQGIGKGYIPIIVYATGLGQLLLMTFGQLFSEAIDYKRSLVMKTVAVLGACSSTIIILSGKQGSLIALALIIGGYCIIRLGNIEDDVVDRANGILTFNPLAVTQWNLLAVCLFFATGHWFDEFVLVRQALLLTIDTFGFSLILPVLGLPLLALSQYFIGRTDNGKDSFLKQMSQVWGLFAPKFVFDAVGLVLTDVCICLASLFYSGRLVDATQQNQMTGK